MLRGKLTAKKKKKIYIYIYICICICIDFFVVHLFFVYIMANLGGGGFCFSVCCLVMKSKMYGVSIYPFDVFMHWLLSEFIFCFVKL